MKIIFSFLCLVPGVLAGDNPFRPSVIAECRDGTRVQIEPRAAGLKLAAEYAVIDLDFALLDRVVISSNALVRAALTNGDRLRGELRDEFIEARTIAGEVKLPVARMAAIEMFRPERIDSDLEKSMVLYFPFDEDTGLVQVNAGREKTIAASHYTVWNTEGVVKGSMYFRGSDAWMRITNSPAINSPVFSFCFWTKSEKMAPDSFTSPYGLLGKHRTGANNQTFAAICNGDGTIWFQISGDKIEHWREKIIVLSEPIEQKWGFVSLVHDGTHAYMYVNGGLAGRCDVSGYRGNAYDLLVGAMQFDGSRPQHGWHGWLDEFRMFDTALTAGQVEALYRHDLWRARKIDSGGDYPSVPSNAVPLKVGLDLADGSLLNGDLLTERLDLDNTPAGAIEVPLEYLASIQWDGTNGAAYVALRNGDVWRGELRQAELDLATSVGDLTVPAGLARALRVAGIDNFPDLPARSAAPDPEIAADDGEIANLVALLISDEPDVREDAARRLVEIGAPALPALRAALEDATTGRRWWIEAVIQQIENYTCG